MRPRPHFSGVFARTLLVKSHFDFVEYKPNHLEKPRPWVTEFGVGKFVPRQGKGRREYTDIAEAFDTALAQICHSKPYSAHSLVPMSSVLRCGCGGGERRARIMAESGTRVRLHTCKRAQRQVVNFNYNIFSKFVN